MSTDAYIMCTSPRSGSTLLCRVLRQTGIAGYPESYFHEPSLKVWCDYYGVPDDESVPQREQLEAIFQTAIAEGTRNTDVFGLRLQRHSFVFLSQKLEILRPGLPSDSQRVAAAFGRTAFIHLVREDKLEQAISYVKASQSGLWHMSSDGAELERLAPAKLPSYNRMKIRQQINRFELYDAEWRDWFVREGITPLRVTYKMLSEDPQETTRRILRHLGLDHRAADDIKPDVVKLADSVSLEWANRYRKEQC